jgi:molybdopterin-containing oxidoreductase family iron-sulfur binding subunit
MKHDNSSPDAKLYGMVIDLDKCTGCGACMVACFMENNVPFKVNETDKLDSITWMRMFELHNGKDFPHADSCWLPRPCMHCAGKDGHGHYTPCASVCPAIATDYSPDTGIVSQIPTRCFGCRYCMAACPYKARYFNWWDPKWPEGMKNHLNPDVSVRMRGVVEKCSFCFHRYQRAMNKAFMEGRKTLKEDEYQTACTQACPAGAITFGDLDNPKHKVHELKKSKHAFRLLERLKTEPKVYYMTTRDWVRRAADRVQEEESKSAGRGH